MTAWGRKQKKVNLEAMGKKRKGKAGGRHDLPIVKKQLNGIKR